MAPPADPRLPTEAVPDPLTSAFHGANSTDAAATTAGRLAPSFGPPTGPGEIGTLGPYRVTRPLGRGGMGAVYAAVDARLDRRLALKVMLPQFAADPAARERFLREARAAARVAHDNVVTVYEADERDGVPYIAMELLHGCPLDEYLKKKGPPSVPQVLKIARETAAGLAAAHRLGLVHRDVKPANLWLEAPRGRVKVLDFGLARPVDAEAEVTRSGAVVGTPAFMSPEQARGEKVDHRTDLFSLGAVLYRLCTGRLPFQGPTTIAVLMALGTEDPPPVRALNPAVPDALAALVHQLLAKDPAGRPQSADEVVRRVRTMMAGGLPADVSAVTYPPGEAVAERVAAGKPARTPSRGLRRWVAAGVAASVVAAAGAVIAIRNKDDTPTKIDLPDGAAVAVGAAGGLPPGAKLDGEQVPAVAASAPKPDAPAPSVAGAAREVSLLEGLDVVAASTPAMKWTRENGALVGSGVGRRGASGWPGLTFPAVISGDYDLEIDFEQRGYYPLQFDLPLGDRAICAQTSGEHSLLMMVDGREGKDLPPALRNARLPLRTGTPQRLAVRVRHTGDDTDVEVTLDGIQVGHFTGRRSRISLPHWVEPDKTRVRFNGLAGDLSKVRITITRAVARLLGAPPGPAAARLGG